MLDIALPPAGGQLARGRALDVRRGGALRGLAFQPGDLQQAFARGVFRVVDHRAIPGELVGAPPDQRDQSPVDDPREGDQSARAVELHKLVGGHAHGNGQRDAKRRGPLKSLCDRDPPDQHRSEHEARHHPAQPIGIIAAVEHGQQKIHQAADQRHDQGRRQRHHDIVGRRLVESFGHDVRTTG